MRTATKRKRRKRDPKKTGGVWLRPIHEWTCPACGKWNVATDREPYSYPQQVRCRCGGRFWTECDDGQYPENRSQWPDHGEPTTEHENAALRRQKRLKPSKASRT